MERPGHRALIVAATSVSVLLTLGVPPSIAAEQTAVETDRIFMQALARSEKAAADPLLDPELLWTDSEGKTQDRAQVLEHLPTATIGDGESKSYSYDQVVTIRSDSGKLHVLRVWVKRPAGWRLLVYHEVRQAETAGSPAPPIKECVNPCQTVPYQPKNDAEAGVFKSWQALETAVTAADSQAWASHFADEFVVISSGGTAPVTKAGRMAALDAQKKAGTNGAPAELAPDHTRMFTFGNTVVMTCQTLPHRGKPSHVTRVWINRGGAWLMTVSFQTTIQAAPSTTTAEPRAPVEAGRAAYASKLSQPRYKVVVEKDVRIPTRHGSYVMADVFRPAAPGERFPPLLSLSVYQKELQYVPHAGPFTHQERPEPEYWVPRGYVLVFVDSAGTGRSPGNADVWSMSEARDYYDAIEWAAAQPWSTGKVGLAGVSYYAVTQWLVASLKPPHLAAFIPWEGFTDMYRDWAYPGGLFAQGRLTRWWADVTGKQLLEHTRIDNPVAYNENYIYDLMVNHLDGPWWDDVKARGQLDQITVPFFSVGNWTSFHFRGNVEGFERAASKDKLFRVHIGGRLTEFYSEEGETEQLRFYDHWLKGIDTGMMREPPVRLCVRSSPRECRWRFEHEFPLTRTKYTKFYLTAQPSGGVVSRSTNDMTLALAPPAAEGALTYDAGPLSAARGARGEPGASFVSDPLSEDTEVTGHVNLVMWIASTTDDADVFARLQKVNPDGSIEAVSDGLLKVSHRKLDPKLSRPDRPFHSHDVEQKLKPGEAVPIEVEVRTTSMIFQKGSRIRVDVLPHDNEQYFAVYHLGNNTIYTGGAHASYILLPIVPARPGTEPDLGGIRTGGPGSD